MNKELKYRGFSGSVDHSNDDKCFFGKLIGINDLITFEAETLSDLEKAFREAVDEYLQIARQRKSESAIVDLYYEYLLLPYSELESLVSKSKTQEEARFYAQLCNYYFELNQKRVIREKPF